MLNTVQLVLVFGRKGLLSETKFYVLLCIHKKSEGLSLLRISEKNH